MNLLDFEGLSLREAPAGVLDKQILEQCRECQFVPPKFIEDLSTVGRHPTLPEMQKIHGSNLICMKNALLFGPNNLVTAEGYWINESNFHKTVGLSYMNFYFFKNLFPGDTPELFDIGQNPRIGTKVLRENNSIIGISEPIFLATPLEPPIWGRWVANVMPRVHHYLEHGGERKFVCHAERSWERNVLVSLGVKDDEIISHEPGRTYFCSDVMSVEYFGGPTLSLSLAEQEILRHFSRKNSSGLDLGKRLFVPRTAATKKNPNYRPLLSEGELTEHMKSKGFAVVEPELIPFPDQISVFGKAEVIVFVGGSAMFNAAFCKPGTRIVILEASARFIDDHMNYLSAISLDYGVIFGMEDPTDDRPRHRRWSLDVPAAWKAMKAFIS